MNEAFEIESKSVKMVVTGKNTRDAFRKFFKACVKDDTWKGLGLIAEINHEDINKKVACRVPPALVLLGKLSKEEGLANVQQISNDFTMEQFEHMLNTDSWVVN